MARKRLSPAQSQYLDKPEDVAAGEAEKSQARRGPLGPPIAQVAAESASESALRSLAEDISKARADGRMLLEIPITDIAPDHLARDRVSQNGDDLAALASSIQSHGQRTPIEVTQLDGPFPYGLISGWRRISALERLYKDTGDEKFSTVLALLRQPKDAADAYVSMVEENEIRVGLSYYERARVAGEAVKRGVFATEKEALLTLFATASRPKRSRIRAFLDIYHAFDGVLQHPAAISERQGLALVQAMRADPAVVDQIKGQLSKAGTRSPEDETSVLAAASMPPEVDGVADAGAGDLGKTLAKSKGKPNVPRAEHLDEVLANGLRVTLRDGKITVSGQGVSDVLLDHLRSTLEGFEPG